MKSIAQKLDQFRSTVPLPSRGVTPQEAARKGVKGTQFLKSARFEEGVSIHSMAIAQGLVNFVGAHSYMNDGGYLRGGIFVGRYCSIGRRVTIGAGMHRMSSVSTFPALSQGTATPYSVAQAKAIDLRDRRRGATVIGNDVWIGDGAVIVEGVEIGSGAIIGANAVVTRTVEPYAIVAGIPGRTVRYRFPETVRMALLGSDWWEAPLDVLRGLPTGNVFEFLEHMQSTAWTDAGRAGFESMHLAESAS